ncbi:ATP-dependent phosphoenolpyruvate carboxykinase [Desulfitobacterium dichloroeliminans LMG P-21439]|uniref:Phosphoenolpyruvate carboxykinase (ATP) n=1 Tax=Desulfitobacterium dichloroeliminans (strain LMG P-21439 / DCA1) TaxID=871963 RepID=L0F647_DESDL|nr:phosphoenolpyruvate carboxykinase (ATP) [Desulfitobacterium dichloroeliminans]AGA68433.1 ATP-dependent phosphoenolpyruvate carboxykinase [Desulfitobacterium dichloroeliminans LMG P-21439]
MDQTIHHNLEVSELVNSALKRGEGVLSSTGAFHVSTGKYTGRSPLDKFIVDEPSVHDQIDWGSVNRPISQENFERLYDEVKAYAETKEELFIFDGFAGADEEYRLPIRVINEFAWQNLFVHQLFIRPTQEELQNHQAQFTIYAVPGFKANSEVHGTHSEAFIICSFEKRVVLIGGTHYAGEMKKSIFSVMNYFLPLREVVPMHCSANIGKDGDVALFFGLSGTGKTTLSADPERYLIGDDEHGWSKNGVFNFEGGCYAKCINLSQEKEPQIWNAIKYGTVLENVILDSHEKVADYCDASLTENTRAAYPIDYIEGSVIPGVGGQPQVIVFLTADAFGVLPPIAKLTKEQAMYHFLSGYTSKLAGTERGITEPQATFSTCFGAPFLPLAPQVYAEMLGERIDNYGTQVYLVNTGWSGGAYGVGKRINLKYTRAMITAALNGSLAEAEFTADPNFGVLIPNHVAGVPNDVLKPRLTWQDKEAYDHNAKELAQRFRKNFEQFGQITAEIRAAGPQAGA